MPYIYLSKTKLNFNFYVIKDYVMAVINAIRKRYSCRDYAERPIEKDKLTEILEAARLAPSARNAQDWRFVVVTDSELRSKLAAATNRPEVFKKAAAIIVACSIGGEVMPCGQRIEPIDVSIALEHIALQAAELELATCWIGSFDPKVVREVTSVPQNIEIIELMTLGYPADEQKNPAREPIDKICCYNKWTFK